MESHLQALIAHLSAHPWAALGVVFAASLLEAVAVIGTVVPGSSIVFVGGVLVGLKALDPWWTAAAAVIGAILGDGVSYWLGHRYRDRIRTLWPVKAYPALFDRGQAYFAENGGKSVFFGRFLGPVRAIVPVAAGMASMPATRFYAVNILSAFAWVAVHIVPGALFGASLQLAGAVSSRLVVILVLVAGAVWVVVRLVRFVQSQGWPRIKMLRDRAVAWARARPGPLARIVLSLFDPTQPESSALLTSAVLLVGSAWLFLGVLEDVVSEDPLVQLDQTVYAALQALRTAWADDVMVAVTELGAGAVVFSVIVAASALFAVKRCWRTLAYWLAAAGFAEILVWTLKLALGRGRPNGIFSGVEGFSFPSGHAASSMVVYGFMAFLMARGKPTRTRIVITLPAALAIVLIAFSRLYLGVHWLSDVLASLSLGLAWVALLSIAYTHHVRNERLSSWPLSLVVLTTLALVGGVYVSVHHSADTARYAYRPVSKAVLLSNWQGEGWRSLPFARAELGGEIEEPFSVQWAGTAGQIADVLTAAGWQTPQAWASRGALLWLLPDAAIEQLPVLPKFDHGEAQKMTFVRSLNPHERGVLRLWPSRYAVDTAAGEPARPLWKGMVTVERLHHPAGLITLAETGTDFNAASRLLEQDLRNQHSSTGIRGRRGATVLLVW